MDLVEAGRRWAAVQEEWNKANAAARELELRNVGAMRAVGSRTGPGPTDADLAEADRLRAVADELKAKGDAIIKEVFR